MKIASRLIFLHLSLSYFQIISDNIFTCGAQTQEGRSICEDEDINGYCTKNDNSNYRNDDANLSDFCRGEGSLHSIAQSMLLEKTAPKAREKLRHVLSLSNNFIPMVQSPFNNIKIFHDIENNLSSMLEGYGLSPLSDKDKISGFSDAIAVEASINEFESQKYNVSTACLASVNAYEVTMASYQICKDKKSAGRVLVNTEQISAYKDSKVFVQILLDCLTNSNCVILEYSEVNIFHMKSLFGEDLIESSVVMLPTMIQSRLRKSAKSVSGLLPTKERKINSILIGTATPRRKLWIDKTNKIIKAAYPGLDISLETMGIFLRQVDSTNEEAQAILYSQSKTCFIIHSYSGNTSEEFHRISEMAPFGCIPIVESTNDFFAKRSYEECGGVVFVAESSILQAIEDAAREMLMLDKGISQRARIQWWENGIRWPELLKGNM